MRLEIATLLAVLASTALVQAQCFVPNGTLRNDLTDIEPNADPYRPCPTKDGSQHSMCCNASNNDKCMDNGLCYDAAGDKTWRESCTDETWQSPACLKLCVSHDIYYLGNPMDGADVQVTQCSDGSFCCGEPGSAITKDCCNNGKGVRIVDGQVIDPSTSSSSSTIGPSTSPTASPSSSPTQPAASTPSSASTPASTPTSGGGTSGSATSSSTPAIVGGAVGGVAAVGLAILGWFMWNRRRKRAAAGQTTDGNVSQDAKYDTTPAPQYYSTELPTPANNPVELGAEPVPAGYSYR